MHATFQSNPSATNNDTAGRRVFGYTHGPTLPVSVGVRMQQQHMQYSRPHDGVQSSPPNRAQRLTARRTEEESNRKYKESLMVVDGVRACRASQRQLINHSPKLEAPISTRGVHVIQCRGCSDTKACAPGCACRGCCLGSRLPPLQSPKLLFGHRVMCAVVHYWPYDTIRYDQTVAARSIVPVVTLIRLGQLIIVQ